MEFNWVMPNTLPDIWKELAEPGSKLLAGGTDLLVDLKRRRLSVSKLVSLNALPELKTIKEKDGYLEIGALVPLQQIAGDELISKYCPVLAQAADSVGSVQVRNRATIGGNIVRAAPSADTAPALLVSEGLAKLSGPGGERTIPLAEFYTGPGLTVLQPGEVLNTVRIPLPAGTFRSFYYKHGRRKAMEIATVNVAIKIELDGSICQKALIALGAVAPTPIRATEAENALNGLVLTDGVIEEAANLCARASQPISDMRSSQNYRQRLVKVLTKRVLMDLAR